MKKRTMKKIAIWTASILVVIIVAGYFAINYAADKVMDSLANSVLDTAIASNEPTQEATSTHSSPTQSNPPSPSSPTATGSVKQSNENTPPKPSSGSDVGSKPSPDGKGDLAGNYSAEVSTTKAENVKDSITFAEKTKVMTILLKKLNADDIKTLSSLSQGGLTVEKKVEAKKLILQKLSEKEYDDLIRIATKYGLSEGKSYEDSKKEKGME